MRATIETFVIKIASRCNLNCDYCYVYNGKDDSWKQKPKFLSDRVLDAVCRQLASYCADENLARIRVVFHGGEPCLVGVDRFSEICTRIRGAVPNFTQVSFAIQTNGTLIDAAWAETFAHHNVVVGVSIDGPAAVHDSQRKYVSGKGSFSRVMSAVNVLNSMNIRWEILTVIPLGSDPLVVHRHLDAMGASSIRYLFPDVTRESMRDIHERFGPTPCADFLCPIIEDWLDHERTNTRIEDLWNFARVLLGGTSRLETIGNNPPRYVFIETNGDMEGLDCLRVCKNGFTRTGFSVLNHGFPEFAGSTSEIVSLMLDGAEVPKGCLGCEEVKNCGGGYLPHRYSQDGSFDNPSVWCADLKKVFFQMRRSLDLAGACHA